MFSNPDEAALCMVQMTTDDLIHLASTNLVRIAYTAKTMLAAFDNIEDNMAVVNMTAALCFPKTFQTDRPQAVEMITELIREIPAVR